MRVTALVAVSVVAVCALAASVPWLRQPDRATELLVPLPHPILDGSAAARDAAAIGNLKGVVQALQYRLRTLHDITAAWRARMRSSLRMQKDAISDIKLESSRVRIPCPWLHPLSKECPTPSTRNFCHCPLFRLLTQPATAADNPVLTCRAARPRARRTARNTRENLPGPRGPHREAGAARSRRAQRKAGAGGPDGPPRPGRRHRVRPPPPLPPPPLVTKWTRRVPHLILIGHAASLTPY